MRLISLFALGLLGGCAGAPVLPAKALELNDGGARALAAGDLETAAARLEVALEYSPRFVDALVNLGLVECQRGNFVRARQLFARALRLNSDVAQPHHGLGVLAERERRPDLASEHYRDALRVDPGFAPARANLGRLQFDAGQYESAYLTFKKLVEVAPDDPSGFVALGETLIRLGRYDEARAIAAYAEQAFSKDERVTLLGARLAIHGGDLDGALRRLSPLTHGHDDLAAAALAWSATAELARGRPQSAAGAARRALALDPQQALAAHILAAALRAVGDRRADEWGERAQRLHALERPSLEFE